MSEKLNNLKKEDRIKCPLIADLGSELKGLENKELNDGLKRGQATKSAR